MRNSSCALALIALLSCVAFGADKISGPDDPDFAVQGDYVGEIKDPGGEVIPVGVQVIAEGDRAGRHDGRR